MTSPSTLAASFLAAKRFTKAWFLFTKGRTEGRGQEAGLAGEIPGLTARPGLPPTCPETLLQA